MKVTVCRKAHFNAAHRLHNPAWNPEKNKEVFGLCNNPNYHGHNYNMIVKVRGEIDPDSGYVIDMKLLKKMIKETVLDRFDHKNLSVEVEEFNSVNATMEHIVVVIWNLLRKELDARYDLSVTLYETERNFVEFSGEY
jgi:6-pyruvoyltetrahydropterin/6-carboxytetrahydropterin synthase